MQYIFGDCRLDLPRYALHGAGGVLPLDRQGFAVLVYLIEHRDRVVLRQELFDRLWANRFVSDAALEQCIAGIRRAVGDSGRRQRVIQTVHGRGYRFIALLTGPPSTVGPLSDPVSAPSLPLSMPEPEPSPRARCGGEGTTRQAEEPSPALALPLTDLGRSPGEALDEEHKQITVLCCALAAAPTLAVRLGPEAMHHLMHDVLALAQDTVQRYEGTLTQVSGDGFLALFGVPVAQEDHARRAVLAALELRQRLRGPQALRGQPHGVAVRLGLHSGPVVVGPLAYEPQRLYTAAGDTLQLATRLQQRAAPDTLLVSAATYALMQDEVQGEVCETLALDGPSTPGPVYAIRGLLRRRAGVPRHGARPLSRFVGRTKELALLHERLEQAVSGPGQVIGIAGEPGVGKSRLLAEFVHRLRGRPVTCCEGHCLAYGSATPYLPVRDLLRQLWDLPDAAPAPAITATVHQRLREAGVASEDEGLVLLQLLDVPVDLAPFAALDLPRRQARTFALLWQVIRQASRRQPLLLAVENLHWTDPTSEAWLATLVEHLEDTPVLLLATYRLGYQPPWSGHSAVTQMALPRLSPRDSRVVLQSVPRAAQLPASLQQAIVAKAAGNPFFVEELTWATMEHGDHAGPLPMPDTIEAVLAARIDRLPSEEKRLLQTAAVIGPEVSVPLLQRLAGLPEDVLQRGLAHLQSREFLYETHRFPEQAYSFKHALTREVAYGSLLHERRRALHLKIVEALEALYPDRLSEYAEHLAQHALRGEVWAKALAYCRQAGEKALARSAYREAVGYFEQALKALPQLPETRGTREQAIDLRLALRSALNPSGDFGRSLAYLREAESLAAALEDPRRLGQVSLYLSVHCYFMGAYDQAIATAQRALTLATASGDAVLHALANQYLGTAYQAQGDYRRAIDCLGQTVASLEGSWRHERLGRVFMPAVLSRARLLWSHAELGSFAEGRALGEEGLRIAEAVDHPASVMIASWGLGLLALRQGDLPRALPLLERAVGLCQDADLPLYFPWMAWALGGAYTLHGRIADAVPLLTRALAQADAMARVDVQAFCSLSLGEAQLRAGRLEEAYTLAEQTLAHARKHKERGNEAYALRLLGEIAAHRDPLESAPAEAHYQQARALADELGMRPLIAHCHLGLGMLYLKIGRLEEARAALATALELYRALEMTFWLPQAEAALAEVEGH